MSRWKKHLRARRTEVALRLAMRLANLCKKQGSWLVQRRHKHRKRRAENENANADEIGEIEIPSATAEGSRTLPSALQNFDKKATGLHSAFPVPVPETTSCRAESVAARTRPHLLETLDVAKGRLYKKASNSYSI